MTSKKPNQLVPTLCTHDFQICEEEKLCDVCWFVTTPRTETIGKGHLTFLCEKRDRTAQSRFPPMEYIVCRHCCVYGNYTVRLQFSNANVTHVDELKHIYNMCEGLQRMYWKQE